MPERDTLEFTAALLIGTALGAGLTWMLLPEDRETAGPRRKLLRPAGKEDPDSTPGGVLGKVGEDFLGAVRDEARVLLREAGGRLLSPGSDEGEAGSS